MTHKTSSYRFTEEEKARMATIGEEIGLDKYINVLRFLINKEYKAIIKRKKAQD